MYEVSQNQFVYGTIVAIINSRGDLKPMAWTPSEPGKILLIKGYELWIQNAIQFVGKEIGMSFALIMAIAWIPLSKNRGLIGIALIASTA